MPRIPQTEHQRREQEAREAFMQGRKYQITDADRFDFLEAYIECALWSETDPDSGESLDQVYTAADLAEEARDRMREDCNRFLDLAADLMAGDSMLPGSWITAGGHDFLLTRNGHGAGFWDGDWRENGDALADIARGFGEINIYPGDDGKLYHFPA